MILLLGGTSDTAPLASKLAGAGYRVLVSTATDTPLAIGSCNRRIRRRMGRLDKNGLISLIQKEHIQVIVDATHPYAVQIRETANSVADLLGLPYLTYIRPSVIKENDPVCFAEDHGQAAELACSFDVPVLLTTGSRNLTHYVQKTKKAGVPLVVRVLPCDNSLKACRLAGVKGENIITGRGPFSAEDNSTVIRKFHIGVIVTKDGGAASGVRNKLEAAQKEGCHVVIIRRPVQPSENGFSKYSTLLTALLRIKPAKTVHDSGWRVY